MTGRRAWPMSWRARFAQRAHEDEEPLDWVVQGHPRFPDRTRGLFHLKGGGWPGFTTLCGLEKANWRTWQPRSIRPPMGMCCRRCMAVATKRILDDWFDGGR